VKLAGGPIAAGAKAAVCFGRMLSDDDYWGLLHCDGVKEIAERLRTTPAYGPFLTGERLPREPHRFDLERAFKAIPVEEGLRFLPYLDGPRRDFLHAWIRRRDADQLKRIFRSVRSGRTDREGIRGTLTPSPGNRIPYDRLLSAHNFEEIEESLRGTPYHQALREPLRRLIEEGGGLFSLEMALDIEIERRIVEALSLLPREDRCRMEPLFGFRLDILNLYWVYRAKRYYDMTPEEILNRLLPARHRTKLPALRALARTESMDEFYEVARQTPLGEYLTYATSGDELGLDRERRRRLWSRAVQVFRSTVPSFPSAMAYIYLKELEAEDLVKIVEDVRYDFDRRQAALYLTRPLVAGGDLTWLS
jgi:V/A-type H+-transporting ATPase subunit C